MSAVLRCWAQLRRGRLDRRLAAGASPSQSRSLRLRADQLTAARERRTLAEAADAIHDNDARGELAALAARLRAAEPISPAGAAQVRLLLRTKRDRGPLWERAWDATDALDDHVR